MNSLLLIIFWFLLGLFCSAWGSYMFYYNSRRRFQLLLSEVEKAENELIQDLTSIDLQEFYKSVHGRKLLKGLKEIGLEPPPESMAKEGQSQEPTHTSIDLKVRDGHRDEKSLQDIIEDEVPSSMTSIMIPPPLDYNPEVEEVITIFDTTLREGEQSPGATLNVDEKLEIARQLSRLGVDICEAGFPIASPGDFNAVRRIAEEVGSLTEGRKSGKPMTIAGLARANKEDIQRAYDAVKVAPSHRIHTFLATSDIHLKHKLRIDREECIDQVVEAVSFAKSLCDDVEFSPEDAGRSDPDFLVQVLGEAIKAGATTLNIPDTVGYTTPEEFGWLVGYLIEKTPGSDNVIWSTHCHNDLGLATANTLAGVQNGARQVEVTINGIGERAGNTSLEEVVMAIETRPNFFKFNTNIDPSQITRSSRMVSAYTGMVVQPNKAIVGANAFAHEAGIHQDGMLKNHQTYEIMRPETVGLNASKLVLGKHSGRHAFRVRVEEMGYGDLNNEELNQAFQRFKRVADKKKVVTDADIEAIIADEIYQPPEIWKLNQIQVSCGDQSIPTASVSLTGPDEVEYRDAALGTGPVDAVYQAINRIIGAKSTLTEFSINAVTEGLDAQAEATIRIQPHNSDGEYGLNPQTNQPFKRTYSGHGASTDIVVASARAYLSALNKMLAAKEEVASVVER